MRLEVINSSQTAGTLPTANMAKRAFWHFSSIDTDYSLQVPRMRMPRRPGSCGHLSKFSAPPLPLTGRLVAGSALPSGVATAHMQLHTVACSATDRKSYREAASFWPMTVQSSRRGLILVATFN